MEFITVELRPRLQSCNVFIYMKNNINLNKIRIEFKNGNILLKIDDTEMKISHPLVETILPNSLSGLSVIDKWICFRTQTKPMISTLGSFQSQIIDNSNIKEMKLNNIDENFIKLFKENQYQVQCTCCKNIITEETFLKRILPLPDFDYDPGEWFCCKHSDENVINNLQPQSSDYFYGSHFSVLNKNIFKDKLCFKNNILSCNRCKMALGIAHERESVKLWNCSVNYILSNSNNVIKSATSPIQDFILLIKNSVNEIGGQVILRSNKAGENHCLSMKLMDLQLYLLTEMEQTGNESVINLQEECVIKVLYKYERIKTSMKDHLDFKSYDVGFAVIDAGLKYLHSSTKRLPPQYRVASKYYIGHINLQSYFYNISN